MFPSLVTTQGVHLHRKPRSPPLARTALNYTVASYVIITSGTSKQSRSKQIQEAQRARRRRVKTTGKRQRLPHPANHQAICDAYFDKTRCVSSDIAMLVAHRAKRKGRHDPRDCFKRCRNNKGIDSHWWDVIPGRSRKGAPEVDMFTLKR